ncbi:hypothetical protein BCR43DRAFT_504031 [Syncephalastrum racemosum]|uniref:Uncharacterized protein n=1 Tax=Syncephalastrum racemosum TaxID=13706 RepID=A0A1X2HK08_SYNRA|nr:hypothetical protein BCR43DRAFT_504031 [Syncephalastrum racemosum]
MDYEVFIDETADTSHPQLQDIDDTAEGISVGLLKVHTKAQNATLECTVMDKVAHEEERAQKRRRGDIDALASDREGVAAPEAGLERPAGNVWKDWHRFLDESIKNEHRPALQSYVPPSRWYNIISTPIPGRPPAMLERMKDLRNIKENQVEKRSLFDMFSLFNNHVIFPRDVPQRKSGAAVTAEMHPHASTARPSLAGTGTGMRHWSMVTPEPGVYVMTKEQKAEILVTVEDMAINLIPSMRLYLNLTTIPKGSVSYRLKSSYTLQAQLDSANCVLSRHTTLMPNEALNHADI